MFDDPSFTLYPDLLLENDVFKITLKGYNIITVK